MITHPRLRFQHILFMVLALDDSAQLVCGRYIFGTTWPARIR